MFTPPKGLVDAVKNRTLVPFVGAGISVGAVIRLPPQDRFPNWSGLIKRLSQRLRDERKTADADQVDGEPDIMAAAELAVERLGRTLFQREMEAAFGQDRAPRGAELSAIQAIWRLNAPFVMTTNYDYVLEWPWAPNRVQRINNDDPSALGSLDAPSTKLRIWYLHGSIARIDTLILTSGQYLKLYPDNETGRPKRTEYQNAFNVFQQLLATRSFLFMGFSLQEPVLRRKLEDVLALTVQTAPMKYLLLKAGEADGAKRQEFFDRYRVQVIECDDFGAEMIAAIDAIGRTAWPGGSAADLAPLTAEMRLLVDELLEQLDGLLVPAETTSRIHNAAKPKRWPTLPAGGDGLTLLRDAVVDLGAAVAPSPDAVSPLLDFVNRLTREVGEPWLTRLRAWLDTAVDRIAPDLAASGSLRQALTAAPRGAAAERVHVLVRIRVDDSRSGGWLVHAWLWAGTRFPESLLGPEGKAFKSGSSEAVVFDLFDQLEARDVDPALTSISFAVPNGLAWQPIHTWTLPVSVAKDPPIGTRYTVTIRPLERLERIGFMRRRFKKAWDELKKRAAEALAILDLPAAHTDGVPAVVVDASAAAAADLETTLDERGARCVVLREAPSASSFAHLSAVVDTPIPAIVWSSDPSADPAQAGQSMRDLLGPVTVAELPRRVRDLRQAAYRDKTGAHRGMYLSLVWDDADYAPPEHDETSKAKIDTI
jgi:hypothetical protein